MATSSSVVPIPLEIHRDGSFVYPGQTFRWDKENSKLWVKDTSNWKFALAYLFIFGFVSLYSFRNFWDNHEIVKMAYSCTIFCYSFFGGCLFACLIKNAKVAADFLNGCRVLEQYYFSNGLTLEVSKIQGFLIKAFLISSRIFPIIFAFGAFFMPCFPVNYFTAVLPHCQSNSHSDHPYWFLQVLASTIASWLVYVPAFNIGFTTTTHILLGFFFQISALNSIKRLVRTRNKSAIILTYRQLQLLSRLFNISHKGILIYAMIGLTVADTGFAYVAVRAPAETMPITVKIAVILMLFEMICLQLVVYGYAGAIHANSKGFIGNAKSTSWAFSDRAFKKTLESCQSLRVVLGESNFFEKQTPLKCFEFSVLRFVDLLLMEKQQT